MRVSFVWEQASGLSEEAYLYIKGEFSREVPKYKKHSDNSNGKRNILNQWPIDESENCVFHKDL